MAFCYQKGKVVKTMIGHCKSSGINATKHLVFRTDGNYLLEEDATINGYVSNLYYWEKNFKYKDKKMQGLASLAHLCARNEKKSSYLDTNEFIEGEPDSGILGRRIGPNQIKYTQKDVSKTLLAKHPRAQKRHLSYSNFKKVKFRTKMMKY